MAAITQTVSLIRALGRAYDKKWSFLAAFLAVFFVTFSTLATFDLIPEAPEKAPEVAAVAVSPNALAAAVVMAAPENALRVEIPSVGINVTVKNPNSTDVAVLDEALLTGAVRYPASAKLGEEGNTILFGHSSYLPIVNNKAFKAFNEIQNLEKGDRITVYGETTAYVYAVKQVASADADSAAIPLTKTGHTLTLATCDSFGKKTDRFIVVADLVESYPLAS
jgi:LPXTG-site transpeptidase (sortase) family protein